MKYEIFKKLYCEASDYDELELYISERGWQDWMDDFESNSDDIVSILTVIYDVAKGEMKTLRERSGLNIKGFSDKYNIPYRTVQTWEAKGKEKRSCPEYLKSLLCYTVINDNYYI